MLAKTKPQLPPIDYVLASVAYGFSAENSARIPQSSAMDEPLEAALIQWGNTLTAPLTPYSSLTRLSKPGPPPKNTASEPGDQARVGNRFSTAVEFDGFTNSHRAVLGMPLLSTGSTQKSTETPRLPPPKPKVEKELERAELKEQPKQRQATSSKPRKAHHSMSTSARRHEAPSTEASATPPQSGKSTRKRKQQSQGAHKHRKRTAQMVVDQIAMCRERLAQIHFRPVERPDGLMECSICQEAYRTKALVTRHAISHLEDPKPFACTVCNKRFSRCDTLHRHCERRACKIEPQKSPSAWEDSCHVLNIK